MNGAGSDCIASQPSTPALDHRVITPLLDDFVRKHAKLTGFGGMKGIIVVDQDAKVIAMNSMFGLKKPWDMGGIAAALHGVAKQASQYFGCSSLDLVAITFGNMQFFVQAIGSIEAGDGRPARELQIVILAAEKVKMGIVLVQMKKVAPRIVEAIQQSRQDMALIRLDERSVRDYLAGLGSTT
jgi:predicted regulator of Ras-like GTPase activity (Roadblock/LC7/MglB family)